MRGFDTAEFQSRLMAAQAKMQAEGLGAILLTTEADFRYFTGFLTRFWESPSRPWYLVVPVSGKPIAVIPSIGAVPVGRTWISDIRTWSAPDPDDDGVSLLSETLREIGGPVGVPSQLESHLRMPLHDFDAVKAKCGVEFTHDHGIVASLRSVKSEAEIEKIAKACGIAGRAFDRMGDIAQIGVPLSRVFRDFQRLLLEEGADCVPYISGGAGPGGYMDVISPASDAPLEHGDVLMLDTGAVWDGYFCDYDRNFAIGDASDVIKDAHTKMIDATMAGLEAAKVGARASDVFGAMAALTGGGESAGRLGHGLGMQLTEGLSLTSKDHSELKAGMVITLEPGIEVTPGYFLVHEENIVIRDDGPQRLSRFRGPDIEIL